jgi:hypothetical protein
VEDGLGCQLLDDIATGAIDDLAQLKWELREPEVVDTKRRLNGAFWAQRQLRPCEQAV